MTDAYKCDRCGEFALGQFAAVRFDIEYMARKMSGDVILDDGTQAPWSREETDLDFCPDCAAVLIEHVNEFLTEADADA